MEDESNAQKLNRMLAEAGLGYTPASANEKFQIGLEAAQNTYEHEVAGRVVPLVMRELYLVLALEEIARTKTSEVRPNRHVQKAREALGLWRSQRSRDGSE